MLFSLAQVHVGLKWCIPSSFAPFPHLIARCWKGAKHAMQGANILCCSARSSTGCCSSAASRELWHLFAESQGMLLTVC